MAKIIRFKSLEISGPLTATAGTLTSITLGGVIITPNGGNNGLRFQNGAANRWCLMYNGVFAANNVGGFSWSSGNDGDVNQDLFLRRDAAGTLAQRNDLNPQTFRIYGQITGSDTSATGNYERGFMRWSAAGGTFQIGTEKGSGGGTARDLVFQTDGVTRMTIAANGNITFGNFLSVSLGTNGTLNAPGGVTANAGASLWNNQCRVAAGGAFVWTTAQWNAAGTDLELNRDAADVLAQRRGAAAQTFRIYKTVGGTNNVDFERANFRWASNEFIIDAEFGGTGTSLRGIKIGSATSSLLGFYGVTPVDQPATVADPAGGGTVDTEARTAINAVIDRLQELGLIA